MLTVLKRVASNMKLYRPYLPAHLLHRSAHDEPAHDSAKA